MIVSQPGLTAVSDIVMNIQSIDLCPQTQIHLFCDSHDFKSHVFQLEVWFVPIPRNMGEYKEPQSPCEEEGGVMMGQSARLSLKQPKF